MSYVTVRFVACHTDCDTLCYALLCNAVLSLNINMMWAEHELTAETFRLSSGALFSGSSCEI